MNILKVVKLQTLQDIYEGGGNIKRNISIINFKLFNKKC